MIVRHGESSLNREKRVNGDPAVDVPLTERGVEESRNLGQQVAHLPLDACVYTRFGRTRQTALLALDGQDVPLQVEPLLDDIDVGLLEADRRGIPGLEAGPATVRRFPARRASTMPPVATRRPFRRLLALRARSVLVVCHEIPLGTP